MKTAKKLLAGILVLTMMLALSVPAFAREEKKQFNYVSFGASNTCGYGLAGFIPDELLNSPQLIYDTDNPAGRDGYWTSGYEFYDERCYPVLIRDALQETLGEEYQVNLHQCAINAFRVDELRYLIDEDYDADSYQMWRMGDESPDSGWLYDLERERHDPLVIGGMEIYDYTKDATSLRDEFKNAIINADYITFDLGVNNFGGFVSQRMLTRGTPDEVQIDYAHILNGLQLKLFNTAKDAMSKIISKLADDEAADTVNYMLDTLAYAYVGFIVNFDACMGKIYELNPGVDMTVVSIMNLMEGLSADIGGITVPFGDLFGVVIDLANNHMANVCCYKYKYSYADLTSDNGHVTFFLDEIAKYNGDPYTLSKDMTVAYDLFDEYNQVPTQLGLYYFDKAALAAGDPYTVAVYDKLSHASYHAMSEFFKRAATTCSTIHLDNLGAFTDYSTRSACYTEAWYLFFNNPAMNILGGMPFEDALKASTAEIDALLASDEDIHVPNGAVITHKDFETFVAMFGRVLFANCLLLHPSEQGHEEAKDIILKAYNMDISGKTATGIAILNTLRAPIVDALGKIFSFIDLSAFFEAIFEQISQFLLKLIPLR